jgi:general L-amino acid transport system permease protein
MVLSNPVGPQRLRKVMAQCAMAVGLVALLILIAFTVQKRLQAQGIASGFGFLWERAGFDLSESMISFNGNDSYFRALLAGFSNTLKVAVCSIVAAVAIGLVAAAAQLSEHALARRTAKLYVAVVRNTPLLLQLFFWFGVFTVSMPGPKNAVQLLPGVFASNRGIDFPWPSPSGWLVVLTLAIGLMASLILWLKNRAGPAWAPTVTLAAVLGFAIWATLNGLFELDIPVAGGFSIRGGGKISPEFLTLFIGLSVYTGSYIAEAIRGAVLAISSGQIDAGKALGLRPSMVLLLIVIPQAIRIALPAVVSELLNLVKNSSLGVAVGYPELVSAGNTTMNQTGQAIELITIYMAVYVTFNFIVTKLFAIWERRYGW